MRIIFDGGGTKVAYGVIGLGDAPIYGQINKGIVPYLHSSQDMENCLKEGLPSEILDNAAKVQELWYYGSACSIEANRKKMQRIFQRMFPKSEVVVLHDMLGAARAVCQRNEGIACILGTGSSACIYDGADILHLRAGIGYVLGDEGGGAYMGKLLLQQVFYGFLDAALMKAFFHHTGLDKDDIIDRVYYQPNPNQFLGSLMQFVQLHREHPQIQALLQQSFTAFFDNQIMPLCALTPVRDVYFSGGVSVGFSDNIVPLAKQYGLHFKASIAQPIQGLMRYHYGV